MSRARGPLLTSVGDMLSYTLNCLPGHQCIVRRTYIVNTQNAYPALYGEYGGYQRCCNAIIDRLSRNFSQHTRQQPVIASKMVTHLLIRSVRIFVASPVERQLDICCLGNI